MHTFLYGIILAFGLIIPLGVQNIFIFNQGATQKHFRRALPSVFTAAICDMLLILLAVLGVSLIVLAIPWLKNSLFIVGFCFLMYMGWMTWNSHPRISHQGEQPMSAKKQIIFASSVSLLNPHAIIDTIGVIGTNSLQFVGEAKLIFTFACMFVSLCWFLGLSFAGHCLHRLDKTGRLLKIVNKFSALIIWGVACYLAYQLYLEM